MLPSTQNNLSFKNLRSEKKIDAWNAAKWAGCTRSNDRQAQGYKPTIPITSTGALCDFTAFSHHCDLSCDGTRKTGISNKMQHHELEEMGKIYNWA